MKILVLSDIHGAAAGIPRVIAAVPNPDLVVIAGDLTQRGGYAEAQAVVEPLLRQNLSLLAVPGNMDKPPVLEYLIERNISIHGRGREIHGIGFFGVGGSNSTPFHTPFELDDDELTALLQQGLAAVTRCKTKILVSHSPPYKTQLDRTAFGIHAGSHIVREFIQQQAPALCISGHIHEAGGREMVGSTLCVNVGAFKDGHYCLIDVSPEHIQVTRRSLK
jgi:Icc-related predicted phosphoesterase